MEGVNVVWLSAFSERVRGRWWLCLGGQEGCLNMKALLSKVINFNLIGNSDKRPIQGTKKCNLEHKRIRSRSVLSFEIFLMDMFIL